MKKYSSEGPKLINDLCMLLRLFFGEKGFMDCGAHFLLLWDQLDADSCSSDPDDLFGGCLSWVGSNLRLVQISPSPSACSCLFKVACLRIVGPIWVWIGFIRCFKWVVNILICFPI